MTDRHNETTENLLAQGRLDDSEIDLAEAALLLASLDRPDVDLTPYLDHLEELASDVGSAGESSHNIAQQSKALARVLADNNNYAGDTQSYDDPQNANLISVIDRRKGLPVALAILYIHAARAQGWSATGINFPGHFLIRLDGGDGRAILDPFNGGIQRDVADLRGLLKQMAGIEAELEPAHYAPMGNRQVLIRLLNNIKLRAFAAKDMSRGAEILDRMLMIVPDDLGLLREAGQCHAEAGNMRRAIEALETVVERSGNSPLRHETEALLRRVKSRLH